ncbi:MAG: N-acetyl-gamma-glutamyl-phosphate reductase [Thermoplasmata archaeon]|jgi:N-acetyl-gamma-glutamyl-phosphate reductase|nr:N-acetyl-gamma-glutamyl-phosphate reductase [Thermoplasmata archaeon]
MAIFPAMWIGVVSAMVDIAVLGARGYLGRELVRILLAHPNVDGLHLVTSSEAGKPYGESVPAFRHRRDLVLAGPEAARDADVVFLATDSDEARKHAPTFAADQTVIDLSRAHRAEALAGGSPWTYGLSELFPVPKGAKRIANPGCYPTATMLAAAPALKAGFAAPGVLISDGKSGVSGAGATPRGDLHYPEANEAVRAYKVLGHDHLAEIRAIAARVEGKAAVPRAVRFTPHLVPQNRGLLATVYLPTKATDAAAVKDAYKAAYQDAAFVRMVPEPDTGHVRGSNFADLAIDLDADSGLLVARGAIDNLVKGGSGAAVQNMNLSLGLPVASGLAHVGGGP